ncbi:DUF5994 family protein [Mycolicibacterium sp. 120270]|nr:DUF5994 family protein [Mycolicibacterium sp. 120270]MDX1884708.1 DUF5994 family protein [Mycolicibacterium sp. 120270]
MTAHTENLERVPRSANLSHELPDLLAVLSVRLGSIERVLYNLAEWATRGRHRCRHDPSVVSCDFPVSTKAADIESAPTVRPLAPRFESERCCFSTLFVGYGLDGRR